MRAALFGSPGVARPFNLPRGMIHHGTFASITSGGGATYAAVGAGDHLDLEVVGVPGTLVIPFLGTENSAALYAATINAVRQGFFQKGGFAATVVAGKLTLTAFLKGSMGGIIVAASTSATVLAALGLTSGEVSVPGAGWGLGPAHMYKAAVAFFGGARPTVVDAPGPPNQHGVAIIRHPRPDFLMVDRNAPTQGPTATSSDSTRFAPLHQPIP